MSGIAIGRCRKTDGLLFYCPHTKHIYSSNDFKLDEGRNTPNTFNLQYEGGIFLGLYDSCQVTTQVEPYPEGTDVVWTQQHPNQSAFQIRGTVISVPVPSSPSQLPLSSDDSPPYIIQLVDGSIHRVSPLLMEDIVVTPPPKSGISFPKWLGADQKVMFLKDGTYSKGYMEYDLDARKWRFSNRRRNGTEL